MASRLLRLLRPLGYLWSAPWGLVGILLAVLGRGLALTEWFRADVGHVKWWRWRGGALEVMCAGPLPAWISRARISPGPTPETQYESHFEAATIGWAIFLWRPESEKSLPHEHWHVVQVLVLGIFFPIVYGVLIMATGYHDHPLEKQARRLSGETEDGVPPPVTPP